MTRYRKLSLCSAFALAISLTACGGDGGSLASIPTPIPVPTPTPTPPPQVPPGTVGAAAQAQVNNASLFPEARNGGPTIEDLSAKQFPLLQTVIKFSGTTATADTASIAGGATLTGLSQAGKYNFKVPGIGLDVAVSAAGGYYCYDLYPCGSAGGVRVQLALADPKETNLSWTSFGTWDTEIGQSYPYDGSHGRYIFGYATPLAAIPRTGSATYTGKTDGWVLYPQETSGGRGIVSRSLTGDATLQANFASRAITGILTNMHSDHDPWNSVSLQGTISSTQNAFSGAAAATSSPGGAAALIGTATGTLAGLFFGPVAQELGAIWTLSDGTKTAIGSIGAKSGP